MMPMASVSSAASMPQQLTHICTDSFFIKVWGVVEKDKFDFVRDMIEVYTPKLAAGHGQLRSLSELIPGKVVLALYNNLFQRAEIVQLDSSNKRKVIVNFIDLGLVTSVDVTEIRTGDSVLGTVPRTGLAEDFILQGVVAKKQWSHDELESANLCLRHCTELNLTGIVGDKKIIQIFMTMNAQPRINLSNFLIEGGLADYISDDHLTSLLRSKYGKMPAPVASPFTVPPPSLPNVQVQVPSTFAIPGQSQIRGPTISSVYPTDAPQTSVAPTYQRIRGSKPAQSLHSVAAVQSYVYPTLPVDSTHDVVVSHVIDGMNSFTVQLKKSTDLDLPKLMAKINDIRPVPITDQIGPGALCLGRFIQDNSLCRAVVSNVLSDGAGLYFVDFGNTEIVPFNEIYKIPPEFLQEPTMALRFALADLTSALSTAEAHNIFSQIVLQEDLDFKLKVVKPLVPTQQRCELFIVINGKAFNVKNKILDKVKLMKPVEYKKITFKKNQVADVTVTFSDSPLRFFVQLDLNQAILEVIMKCVEEYCVNSENKDILFTEDIVENMAVCAPYEDDKYYRGLIVDEPDNEGNITVFYVDYGNQDTVHYSKLRIMNNEMMSQFPTQAIECRLDIESSLVKNEELVNMFVDLVDGENFKMSVKNTLPGNVLLVDLVDQNGVNVAKSLTEAFSAESTPAGYAAPPKPPLQKSSSGNWREKNNAAAEGDFSSFRDERSRQDNRDDRSRPDSNSNHFRSSHDDRGRGRNYDSRRRDSDGVDTTDEGYKKSGDFWGRDKGSRADSGESWRHDKFSNDQSNDKYGGSRDRNDTRGSNRNDHDNWNSRNNQDDSRVGFGERRSDRGGQGGQGGRSRDFDNKTSDDEFGGRPKRDGFRGRQDGDDFGGRPKRDDGFKSGFNDRPRNDNGYDNKNSNSWNNKTTDDNAWDNKTDNNAWNNKTDNNSSWNNKEKSNDSGWGSSNDRGGRRDFGNDRGGSFGDRKDGGFRKRDDNFSSGFDRGAKKWGDDFESNAVILLDGFEKGSKIADADYQPGQELDSIISWFVNPVNFYIMPNNNADFKNLMEQIQSEYPTRKTSNTNDLSPNDHVVARDKDNVIYRANVLRTSPRGVVVTFVDYGNTETVGKNQVWTINPDHCVIPQQAILCSLHNITSNDENGVWKATTEYDNYFGKDSFKATLVECVKQEDDSSIWTVNLIDPDGQDVADQLVANNLALRTLASTSEEGEELYDLNLFLNQVISVFTGAIVSSKKFFVHIEPDKADHISTYIQELTDSSETIDALPADNIVDGEFCLAPMESDYYRALILNVNSEEKQAHVLFIDYGDETDVSFDLLKILPEYLKRYSPQAVQCCLFDSDSFTNEDDFVENLTEKDFNIKVMRVQDNVLHVKLFDVKGTALPYPAESDETVPVVCPAPVLRLFENVVVSSVGSGKVYLQRPPDQHAVNDMNNKLFEKYENELEQEKVEVEEGKFYVAKSGQFEAWYRCQLLEPGSDKIFYIDYGNTESIEGLLAIRPLDEEFYNVPVCCFPVSTDADIPDESIETLMAVIQEIVFKAIIKNTSTEGASIAEFFAELSTEAGKTFVEHVIELNSGTKRFIEPEPVYNAFENWKPNESKNVIISALVSPANFHLILRDDADKLAKLQEDLENSLKTVLPLLGTTDMLCAAKSVEDNKWYRCYQADNVAVDCGLVIVPSEYKKLPAQFAVQKDKYVVKCRLDVASPTADWLRATIDFFSALVRPDNVLVAKLEAIANDQLIVDLITDNNSVTESLLNEGLVKYQDYNVTISHAVSLSEFYIQDVSKEDELFDLLDKLKEGEDAWETVIPEQGQIVSAKFPEDEQWYRAEVVSIVDADITVLFIDYGNQSVCTEFRVLPDELGQLPRFARRCTAHPLPENADELKDKFVDFVENHSDDTFQVYYLSRHSEPLLVMLYFGGEIIDKALAEKVEPEPESQPQRPSLEFKTVSVVYVNSPSSFYVQIETPLLDEVADRLDEVEKSDETLIETMTVGTLYAAKFPEDGTWYRAEAIAANEVLFIDFGNTAVVEEVRNLPEDLKVIPILAKHCAFKSPPGLDAWPQVATERFNELTCNGDAIFTMDIVEDGDPAFVQLIDNGVNVIDELYTLCQAELTAPSIENTKPTVLISYVDNLNEVWIQEQTPALDELCEELSNVETFDALEISSVELGIIVAALFDEDDTWYRAKVLEKSDDGCRVLFIDYGNESNVTQIKSLPEDLAGMPAFATKCRLSGLPEDAETTLILDKLKDMSKDGDSFVLLNKEVKDDATYVSLQTDGGAELSQQLIELHSQTDVQQEQSSNEIPAPEADQGSPVSVDETVSEPEVHNAPKPDEVQNAPEPDVSSNSIEPTSESEPNLENGSVESTPVVDSVENNDQTGAVVESSETITETVNDSVKSEVVDPIISESVDDSVKSENTETIAKDGAQDENQIGTNKSKTDSVDETKENPNSDLAATDVADGALVSAVEQAITPVVTKSRAEVIELDTYSVAESSSENDTASCSSPVNEEFVVNVVTVKTEKVDDIESSSETVENVVPSLSTIAEKAVDSRPIPEVCAPNNDDTKLDDSKDSICDNDVVQGSTSSVVEESGTGQILVETECHDDVETSPEPEIVPKIVPNLSSIVEKALKSEAVSSDVDTTKSDESEDSHPDNDTQNSPSSSVEELVDDDVTIVEVPDSKTIPVIVISSDEDAPLNESGDSLPENNTNQSDICEITEDVAESKPQSGVEVDTIAENVTKEIDQTDGVKITIEDVSHDDSESSPAESALSTSKIDETVPEETSNPVDESKELIKPKIEEIDDEEITESESGCVKCDVHAFLEKIPIEVRESSYDEASVPEITVPKDFQSNPTAAFDNIASQLKQAFNARYGNVLLLDEQMSFMVNSIMQAELETSTSSNVAEDLQQDRISVDDDVVPKSEISSNSENISRTDGSSSTGDDNVSEQPSTTEANTSSELGDDLDGIITSKANTSSEDISDYNLAGDGFSTPELVKSEDSPVKETSSDDSSETVTTSEFEQARSPASTLTNSDGDCEPIENDDSSGELSKLNENIVSGDEVADVNADEADTSFESPCSPDNAESVYLSMDEDGDEKKNLDVSIGSCSTFVGEIEESLLLNDSTSSKDSEPQPNEDPAPVAVESSPEKPESTPEPPFVSAELPSTNESKSEKETPSSLSNETPESKELSVSAKSTPSKKYPTRKLEDRGVYTVTCVQDPGNFFVQKVSDSNFVRSMEKHLRAAGKRSPVVEPQIGSIYCGSMGNSWYRVKLVDSDRYHGYEVFCIDFGNVINTEKLFDLPGELKTIAPFATRCGLPMPAHLSKWPLDVQIHFEEITLLNNPRFELQHIVSDVDKSQIQIVNLSNEDYDVWKEIKEMCVKYEDECITEEAETPAEPEVTPQ